MEKENDYNIVEKFKTYDFEKFTITLVDNNFFDNNKENIAFVFDGKQDFSYLYYILKEEKWCDEDKKINFYILNRKKFKFFKLRKTEITKINKTEIITVVLKDSLKSDGFYSRTEIKYIDKYLLPGNVPIEIYSGVKRKWDVCKTYFDEFCFIPYTAVVIGSKKEIFEKLFYDLLTKLEREVYIHEFEYQNCYFGYILEILPSNFILLDDIINQINDVREPLIFVTKNKVTEIENVKDFSNLFYSFLIKYNSSVLYEELSDDSRMALDDFCNKLINELGNVISAFEIDEPFMKKKVNRFYSNVATYVIKFEKYIMLISYGSDE